LQRDHYNPQQFAALCMAARGCFAALSKVL
jgi:hypothetical protein